MDMSKEQTICAASIYQRKYYLDPVFADLPTTIQNELKAMAVLFTEENGGTLQLFFNEAQELELRIAHNSDDFSYDAIGAEYKVRQLARDKEELFEQLALYYRVFHKNDLERFE